MDRLLPSYDSFTLVVDAILRDTPRGVHPADTAAKIAGGNYLRIFAAAGG